jgi:hypothetical protein
VANGTSNKNTRLFSGLEVAAGCIQQRASSTRRLSGAGES